MRTSPSAATARGSSWTACVTSRCPRIRDFRGLSAEQFDGHGNYTFGLQEQSVFHEINQDKIDRVRGFDITVVTTAKTDDEGRALLRAPRLPVPHGRRPGVTPTRSLSSPGPGPS